MIPRSTLFIALFLISSETFSNEVLDVHYQDRRPEVYVNSSKDLAGPIIEITRELLRNSNITPDFKFVPWTRTLHKAQKDLKSFLLIRHSMTDERKKFLLPIIYGQEKRSVHFYKKKNSQIKVNNLEDLKKYDVAYRRGSFYFPEFSHGKDFNKTSTKSDQQMIKMLLAGRVDLIIFNQHNIIKGHLKEMGIDFDSNFEKTNYAHKFLNPRFFSLPRSSKAQLIYKKLNCEMLKLRKSEFVTKAFKNHSLTAPAQDFSDYYSLKQIEICKD